MTVQIRQANAADIPDLIIMVDELNAHEGEPLGAMTPAKAARDLIGPDAALGAFVAEADGVLIGFAFWHAAYETCYAARGGFVNDLYVREGHRGGGVGKALLQSVARATAAEGGEFIWLTAYRTNDLARAAYRQMMDVEEENVVAYALTGERFAAFIRDQTAKAAG